MDKGYRFSRRGCPDCGGPVIVKRKGGYKTDNVYACESCGKEYKPGDKVLMHPVKREVES